MPILVNCPKCKTKFQVSEKFAGMEGPCPKCKAKIRIPKAESAETTSSGPATASGKAPAGGKQPAAAKPDAAKPDSKQDVAAKKQPAAPLEVKIQEPETIGPKTSTGRPVVKPLTRKETQFALVPSLAIAGGTLLTFIIAWLMRQPLQEQVWLRAVGLLLFSAPLAVGAYWFLQNDELEPHRGRSLWLRGGICGLVYLALWGAYHLLPADATSAAWSWIYIAPPFFLIGAGAAFATFDLEIENAFFHYCFYVLVTLALGFTAGLPMPWNPQTKPRSPGATASVAAHVASSFVRARFAATDAVRNSGSSSHRTASTLSVTCAHTSSLPCAALAERLGHLPAHLVNQLGREQVAVVFAGHDDNFGVAAQLLHRPGEFANRAFEIKRVERSGVNVQLAAEFRA